MKCRLFIPISVFAIFLSAALSTGTVLFLYAAVLVIMAVILGWISVYSVSATLNVTVTLSDKTVHRGEDVTMTLSLHHKGWIPVAPVLLSLSALPDGPLKDIRLKDVPGRLQQLSIPFHASHVGVAEPGVKKVIIEDLLGIFSIERNLENSLGELLVLPLPFDIVPLNFAAGDPGSEIMAAATEDLSSPSDIRTYQPGDPIKKIHWKLSLRKNELLVRKYEEPVLQDALILLDCSRPPSWGHPEAETDLRDALLETTASVYNQLLTTDHHFRIPIIGKHPVEIDQNMGEVLAFDNLCRVDFSAGDRFEHVLQMETFHLRNIGSTVIITARLNSNIVDIMIRMHRMGPAVRLYLITFVPDDAMVLPLIGKLKQASIEVSYVTPVQA